MSMISTPKKPDSISWKDVEALPLYAVLILFLAGVAYVLTHHGAPIQDATMKAALLFGCLGLRFAWVGMDADHEHNKE